MAIQDKIAQALGQSHMEKLGYLQAIEDAAAEMKRAYLILDKKTLSPEEEEELGALPGFKKHRGENPLKPAKAPGK